MLFKDIFIGGSGGHFVQQSGPVCAIMVEGILENIFVIFFQFGSVSLKDISVFSYGCHFVQQSATVCVILVEGNMRNIPVTLF